MGKIRMKESPHIGSPRVDVDYTYCDKCGSFSVEKKKYPQSDFKKFMGYVGALLACGVVISFLLSLLWKPTLTGASVCGFIGVISIVFVGISLSTKSYLRCRKCGNKHITDDNVLGYKENDKTVIDVPGKFIIKLYVETGENCYHNWVVASDYDPAEVARIYNDGFNPVTDRYICTKCGKKKKGEVTYIG
jgi:hypothetical protein